MAVMKKNQMTQVMFVAVDKTDFATIESGVSSGFTQRLWGVKHGVSTAATVKTPSKTISVVSSGILRATLKSTEISDFDYIIYKVEHASCAVQILPFQVVDNDDSDIMSALTVLQSMASDAASAAQQTNSRVLLNQSRISDAYSMLSDFYSDFQSRVPKRVATDSQLSDALSDIKSAIAGITVSVSASDISDIASRVWSEKYHAHSLASSFGSLFSVVATNAAAGSSRALLNQSRISDVLSLLSDLNSHVVTTGVPLDASTISDIRSAIAAGPAATITASDISDIASAVRAILVSDLSDILSAAVQTNSRALVIQSLVSDVDSALTSRFSNLESLLTTTGVQINASSFSDIRSAIAAGPAATVTASDISDIASAVRAILVSDLSDILSAAQQTNSRVLVVQSFVSDVDSALTSRFSNLESLLTTTGVQVNASSLSDIRSAIAAITASVSASDISDIASAVRATLVSDLSDILSAAQQANSRVLVVQSMVSDVDSALTSRFSNVESLLTITGIQLNASSLSDIASAVRAILVSDLSDIYSAATQTNSRALVVQSFVSDIESQLDVTATTADQINSRVLVIKSTVSDTQSLLSDFQSNISARIPATLSGGRMRVDVEAIGTDTTALANLKNTLLSLATGSAVTGTLSTTQMTTDLTGYGDDTFNGRLLTFRTGNLAQEQTEITDYVSTTGLFTFTAVTQSPANGDTFSIT